MEIIKKDIATIKNNNPELDRVSLSIAMEIIDGEQSFLIITDGEEDCGPHFDTLKDAEEAIFDMWGKSPEWDLQYN